MKLRVDDVSYSYNGKDEALRDVSFSVEKGTIYGIMGETGSGKSTLLKLLNGLYTPTKGKIYLDGEDYSSLFLLYMVSRFNSRSSLFIGTNNNRFLGEGLLSSVLTKKVSKFTMPEIFKSSSISVISVLAKSEVSVIPITLISSLLVNIYCSSVCFFQRYLFNK